MHFAGTMRLKAELDIADALDLDRALAHGAASLKALGSEGGADARRSAALGDPRTHADGARPREGRRGGRAPHHLPAARKVVLHAHFDAHP